MQEMKHNLQTASVQEHLLTHTRVRSIKKEGVTLK